MEEEMVKVELLGNRLSDAGYTGVKGDIRSVPESIAKKWCSMGWAKDVAGEIPCGERDLNPVSVNPKKSIQTSKSEVV